MRAIATTAPTSAPPGTTTSTETSSTTIDRTHEGRLVVLGDSLTLGADGQGLSERLRTDGWQPELYADVGRSLRGGLLALQVDVPVGLVSPLVVVELGTNPDALVGTFAAEVDTMVDQLHERGARRIVWITPVFRDDDRYDAKVDILLAKAAADPTVVVADWRPIAKANLAWFRPDGIHYTDPGFAAYAQFVVDNVDRNDPS